MKIKLIFHQQKTAGQAHHGPPARGATVAACECEAASAKQRRRSRVIDNGTYKNGEDEKRPASETEYNSYSGIRTAAKEARKLVVVKPNTAESFLELNLSRRGIRVKSSSREK